MNTPQPSDIPRPFDWARECPEYTTPTAPAVNVAAYVARLRAMFPPIPRQQMTR